MIDAALHDKIDTLTDLEIAVLIPLIVLKHCIIETTASGVDDLERELRLIINDVFGLSHNVVECNKQTSAWDIYEKMFISHGAGPALHNDNDTVTPENESSDPQSPSYPPSTKHHQMHSLPGASRDRKLANVLIAKNFHLTPHEAQISFLEKLNVRQIPTADGAKPFPRTFLFLPLIVTNGTNISYILNLHLMDKLFSSYYHPPEDGFPNLEHGTDNVSDADDSRSMTSVVVRKSPLASTEPSRRKSSMIGEHGIDSLRSALPSAYVSPEVTRYIHDITVFLRMDRAVAGGITSRATCYVEQFARCLALIQRANYVSPALVHIAARTVHRHRIILTRAEQDRSLMYGGELRGSEKALKGVTPEEIIENVLQKIDAVV